MHSTGTPQYTGRDTREQVISDCEETLAERGWQRRPQWLEGASCRGTLGGLKGSRQARLREGHSVCPGLGLWPDRVAEPRLWGHWPAKQGAGDPVPRGSTAELSDDRSPAPARVRRTPRPGGADVQVCLSGPEEEEEGLRGPPPPSGAPAGTPPQWGQRCGAPSKSGGSILSSVSYQEPRSHLA